MKVAIAYPPLESKKGVPLLSQNRQFQWFKVSTYIYPVIPAYAATMLNNTGHQILWLDGIVENLSFSLWLKKLKKFNPDLVFIETKTPVVKLHWQIIKKIKDSINCKVILAGDHVTALPFESFNNSLVDYILTGGDFDFLLLNLAEHLDKKIKLEPGIFYKKDKKIITTGKFKLNHNLNSLPFINRDLTKWQLYAFKNGNFKKTPGAYTMAGRDCWHRLNGGCAFCSWTSLFPSWRFRKPELLVNEIGLLIKNCQIKTVFDDTGTFPISNFLKKFCQLMIKKGYNQKIDFSCNMRFGACSLKDYKMMKKAGFRMILFGLESANQKTLDKINKNIKVKQVVKSCQQAKQAGLEPHLTIMLGYPWETKADILRTIQLGTTLLKKGYADSLQATLVIPYPGTLLFKQAKNKGLIKTFDWNKYDMKQPILKTKIKDEQLLKMIQDIYKVAFNPQFILRKMLAIKSINDLKYYFSAGKKVLGHIADFKK